MISHYDTQKRSARKLPECLDADWKHAVWGLVYSRPLPWSQAWLGSPVVSRCVRTVSRRESIAADVSGCNAAYVVVIIALTASLRMVCML